MPSRGISDSIRNSAIVGSAIINECHCRVTVSKGVQCLYVVTVPCYRLNVTSRYSATGKVQCHYDEMSNYSDKDELLGCSALEIV